MITWAKKKKSAKVQLDLKKHKQKQKNTTAARNYPTKEHKQYSYNIKRQLDKGTGIIRTYLLHICMNCAFS